MVSSWLNAIVSLVGVVMFVQVGEVLVFNAGYPKMFDWHINLAALIFAPREDVVEVFGEYVKHWDVMNTHLVSGALWVFILYFQTNKSLRSRYIEAHRWVGRLGMIVTLCCSLAIFMIPIRGFGYSNTSNIASIFLASWWLISAYKAWSYARAKHVRQHQRWAIRMVAVSSNIAVLRVIFITWNLATGYHSSRAIRADTFGNLFWIGGVLSVLLGEVYLHQLHGDGSGDGQGKTQ